MYPTILRWKTGIGWLGTIEITSYFLAVTVGFVVGTILLWRWARRNGIDGNDVLDLAIWMVVFGLVGAKLLHVVADGYFWDYVHVCTDPSQVFWNKYRVGPDYCRELAGNAVLDSAGHYAGCRPVESNCFGWINLFAGGYTFYGGFIAAAVAAIVMIRRRRLPLWRTVDTMTWIVMLGLGFGRIGCFLNGCCFGRTTDSWIGVVFPRGSPAWLEQVEAHRIGERDLPLAVMPTQAIECVAAFGIAAFLHFVVERRRRYEGQVFVAGLAIYAVFRIGIEFLRDDTRGGLLGISTSQWIGAAVLVTAFLLHRRLSRAPHSRDGGEIRTT